MTHFVFKKPETLGIYSSWVKTLKQLVLIKQPNSSKLTTEIHMLLYSGESLTKQDFQILTLMDIHFDSFSSGINNIFNVSYSQHCVAGQGVQRHLFMNLEKDVVNGSEALTTSFLFQGPISS